MKDGKRIPFVTVVTDLGEAHPWWFNKGLDKMFVPIEEMKAQALEFGLKEEQVSVCGLPLRKGFWNIDSSKKNKELMRDKLELKQDWRVVILIGGGDGMGKLKECAMSFFALKSSGRMQKLQIVIICGKNEKLQKQLTWEAEKVKQGLTECDIRILGFVSNMEEWMIAADVLVTKAGPGTIAEACCCGLPVLLFDFLPGQEEGNVTFVESSGMGEFVKDTTKVGGRCLDWLEDEEGLVRMQQASFKHAERNSTAAMKIAKQTLDVILDEEQQQSIDESVSEWAGRKKETIGAPAASKFVYKSSWWSWFSPANLTQAPSWWRETEVKE
ncbi:hypothetical protein GUITHDRAFT_156659 [Guillardia theta CCMP2712]|uniref:monogalactosyldiacylglycerol synthase n=2 Tax=Guillardia theta TaxID=55529 RepID=L1I5L3_GUITC|nr:hypothetical protein GUITHDRAFT_156659 [Guillardia theta CCMP2712]EKX31174.1 hypothetical protein GUITHDRAFT_156659 [Guillardia theta CCMP2712]|eukprot:XP_005818154.1 hypothetical protein GUITHDRAFT_156659 [Guillardia theta CCMP2712]